MTKFSRLSDSDSLKSFSDFEINQENEKKEYSKVCSAHCSLKLTNYQEDPVEKAFRELNDLEISITNAHKAGVLMIRIDYFEIDENLKIHINYII